MVEQGEHVAALGERICERSGGNGLHEAADLRRHAERSGQAFNPAPRSAQLQGAANFESVRACGHHGMMPTSFALAAGRETSTSARSQDTNPTWPVSA